MKKNKIDVFSAISEGELKTVMAWLIPSLEKQEKIDRIDLCLINYTGKGQIYTGPEKIGKVFIKEIKANKNLGFGESHNFAFKKVKPENVFLIINPDIYLHKDCIAHMVRKFESDKAIGIVEGRQLPFEHPKEYDKKTGETPWASGACMMIRSEFFKKSGGFDDKFWMYEEDVDLSWRAWVDGYKVLYCPSAVAYHYTGIYFGYSGTRYNIEHLWSVRNFIYLMFKYWGLKGEKEAISYFRKVGYPVDFQAACLAKYKELRTTLNEEDFGLLRQKTRKGLQVEAVGFNQFKFKKGKK